MDSLPPDVLGPILTTAGQQLIGTKYGTTATLFLFAYDHLLTLPEEIEYIWKRKFSAVTFLFFINRYYALCIFTVTLMTLVLPDFSQKDCDHSVFLVPFMSGIPMTIFPDIVIGIRVYALYGRNKILGLFLATYILAELSVALWLYTTPSLHAITLPGPPDVNDVPVLHDCIANSSARFTALQSAAYQFMQSGYDTIAFLLIAYKTFSEAFGSTAVTHKRTLRYLMARDGILYYAVAFLCNLTWALMIVFAPAGLKYSAAEATVQLVCLSVNRLTLSLRSFQSSESLAAVDDNENLGHGTSSLRYRSQARRASWIGTSTFEIGIDFEPKSLDFGEVPQEAGVSSETIQGTGTDDGENSYPSQVSLYY